MSRSRTKPKKVYIVTMVGSEGETDFWLLNSRQFIAVSGYESDPMQWLIDGGDKREESLQRVGSLKELITHLKDHNLEIADETSGMMY